MAENHFLHAVGVEGERGGDRSSWIPPVVKPHPIIHLQRMNPGEVEIDKQGSGQATGYGDRFGAKLRFDAVKQSAPEPVILALAKHGAAFHAALISPQCDGI